LVVIAMLVAGCGGATPARPVESGALVVKPATPPPKPPAPAAPERPAEVAAWLHIDDPDAVLDVLGMLGSSQAMAMPMVLPWLELVDTRQPIDVVMIDDDEKTKDAGIAARLSLRDTRAMVDKLRGELDVMEEGKRIHVRKHGRDEDALVCDLGSTRGPDVAICGTPHTLERVGDWLETAPLPSPEESARVGKASPLLRAVIYAAPFARKETKDASDEKIVSFLRDAKSLAIELGRDGSGLAFAATARFTTRQSKLAAEIFEPANVELPNEAFYRVWQETSAAAFFVGGGALPKWAPSFFDADDPNQAKAAERIAKAAQKPFVVGYGVRLDRARTALAAVRTAKDPEKAMQALTNALDSYSIGALAMDIADAEALAKDLGALKNTTKPPPFKHRVAPAALGLPKGSFFTDLVTNANAKPKPTVETTLYFASSGSTWMVTGPDDAACVDTAKKMLVTKAPKIEEDALFKRKGVVAAGYLSSLVGAFALHRFTIGFGSLTGNGASTAVLAEIEKDLALKRMPLPFVVTAQRQGDGGIATFEVRGERDAFQVIGEHVGSTIGTGLGFIVMLMAIGGGGFP
jgi:hypothetical protein